MNSSLETVLELEGKLEIETNLSGELSVPISQVKEIDNEYGGKTAIIG